MTQHSVLHWAYILYPLSSMEANTGELIAQQCTLLEVDP
jgi:hypothetical protein